MVAVHQFVATLAPRDAIGTHTRHARRILQDMGIESDLYADGIVRGIPRGEARAYRRYPGARNGAPTWLLYQLSTGSRVADFLLARPEPKVVSYHNITPAALIRSWEPYVGIELDGGRRQLTQLAAVTELGVAVSTYNEGELREAGYRETAVAPVLVDLDARAAEPDAQVLGTLQDAKARGGTDWLFVGRVLPHKCQHEVIKAFALYRRVFEPAARLHLVGAMGSHAYWQALGRYVRALGLEEAVHLAGSVPDAALAAYYRAADVFVCLSEHEGFCVPVVEAMRERVPVVAFAAAAVPETVAGAGLLLTRKDAATVAAAVARVAGDAVLRERLVAAGVRRAGELSFDRARRRFVEVIEELVS